MNTEKNFQYKIKKLEKTRKNKSNICIHSKYFFIISRINI